MALSFMRLAEVNIVSLEEADSFLFRAKSLLEQVLRSDDMNEKALLRLSNVLIDLNAFDQCEKNLSKLQEVAF
eukprot:CAMPEP_0168621092 /NCGR_PEP_ID=MMETSP0449_2-20121227/7502_1 /TAXON_ID=1082188 /ORGANISM="Strombidium rassoulzadegani, Strain ras09" /LENGTH=72 /DNA_ID=CAMNT_0008662173 /DNA_START=301 /DNA_END=519 /DNA_ORIENTATION=-